MRFQMEKLYLSNEKLILYKEVTKDSVIKKQMKDWNRISIFTVILFASSILVIGMNLYN